MCVRPLSAGLLLGLLAAGGIPTHAHAQQGAPRFRGGLELSSQRLLDGAPSAEMDLFGVVTPVLAYDGGPELGLELGAPLRVRLPVGRAGDVGVGLRQQDWDARSDLGQVLRALRVGAEDSVFALRAGALTLETLGRGELVSRYTNRLLPDEHPAGATVRVHAGTVRAEVLAGDVLAARLFAGELAVDVGGLLGVEAWRGVARVGLGAAHDAGRGPVPTPRATLMDVHADAALHRGGQVQLVAFGHLGSRLDLGRPTLGGQLGLEAETQLSGALLGVRLAARRVGEGYRVGYFGADYELARFAATGFRGGPLAEERLPGGFSGYGLFQLGLGPQDETALRSGTGGPRAVASVSVEWFRSGRTDVDAMVQVDWRGLTGAARLVATGLGQAPRALASIEARVRVVPSFYVLGAGGTAFFPQPDGSLRRGVMAQLGVGADFEG